ncbi:MAG: calcium/sodium antiporter [Roseofilum sp. SBFL]|uniref:calcium/sodium antiporter n=1 Tax=unclassified Roseofilum TaxID=2620099 RepID=UPI001AFED3BD|nr:MULTISPECIES: calcium/sodium antiporter [unclassified Roseofilum]MBP0013161.1 calcium/sodium antiporter [Roseofilum sp. SID3]MBP0025771.1 calcium/sodium antiporter [Roseofilum sp. SID2]MBP0036853.1 calcium/sodium antiporter [Roseofilum sp. SID1]MBP0044151.1 calcium/sodium antiporter [Roseofilum sp. SBFL]
MTSVILLWSLVFIISLAALIKSSDFFTDSAEVLGLFFRLPSFIVGVLLLSVGTSLPELLSSLVAVFDNSSEIVFGNVLGSNIANIFLIVGVAAVFSKGLILEYDLTKVDLPLLLGSALLLILAVINEQFSHGEAIFCILGYIVYLFYTLSHRTEEDTDNPNPQTFPIKEALVLVTSCFGLYFGAVFTIESVTQISETLNIGKHIIAVSAVALGTSLPELIVSLNAARKGNAEMALGNVVGSNIFNSLVVMGIPGLIAELEINHDLLIIGLPFFAAGTLLFYTVTQDKHITQWEGLLFFVFYGLFIAKFFDLV